MALTEEYKTKAAIALQFRVDDVSFASAIEYVESNASLEASVISTIDDIDVVEEQKRQYILTSEVDKVDEVSVDYPRAMLTCNMRRQELLKHLANILQLDLSMRINYHKPRRFSKW